MKTRFLHPKTQVNLTQSTQYNKLSQVEKKSHTKMTMNDDEMMRAAVQKTSVTDKKCQK